MAFRPQCPSQIGCRSSGRGCVERSGLRTDEAACCVAAAFKIDQGSILDRAVALDCAGYAFRLCGNLVS